MKDVTQVINEARNKGHLLLSVELDLGQQLQRKPEEKQSAGDLPYLLLYANDQALAEPNSVAASLQRYDPFKEGGESSHSSESSQHMHRPSSSADLKGRVRREATVYSNTIENNELPEVDYRPNGYRKDDLWESTWYLALKPKPTLGKKEKKRKGQEEDGGEQSNGGHDNKEDLVLKEEEGGTSQGLQPEDPAEKKHKGSRIMMTNNAGRRHELRNEEKDGKKHKGSANPQSPVLSFDAQTMRKARRRQWGDNQLKGCSRRNLRVDFADIGWSEWVIAPKAFDAYYCAGACGFPMPKVGAQSSLSAHHGSKMSFQCYID